MAKIGDSVLNSDKSTVKDKLNNADISLKDVPFILFTFVLVSVGWIFFRTNTINDALYVIKKIVSEFSLFDIEIFYPKRLVIIFCFIIAEWVRRCQEHPLQIDSYPFWTRMMIYYFIVAVILLL